MQAKPLIAAVNLVAANSLSTIVALKLRQGHPHQQSKACQPPLAHRLSCLTDVNNDMTGGQTAHGLLLSPAA
jgi:hypothetical protein